MPKPEPDSNSERIWETAEMIRWKHMSRKEVAAKYHLGETNVNHWLQEAEERGVLVYDIDRSFAIQGELNAVLANELIKEFALEKALVIDVSKTVQEEMKAGDLHTILANRTGMSISGDDQYQGPITANSCLLCAGGRTVVQVARKISRRRLAQPGVRVDPLSGRNWTGSWQAFGPDDLERPLDADDAAVMLASAFPRLGTRFSQIGHPLYAETATQAKMIMRDHCAFLPDGRWNWDLPQRKTKIAICGIGALTFNSGHRVMRFLETYLHQHGAPEAADLDNWVAQGGLAQITLPEKPSKAAPYLSRVAVDLLKALTFAGEKELGACADVANRLYPCLPLPNALPSGTLPPLQDYENLLDKLGVLNHRAIVAQWSHLREASTWITAGGVVKFPAVWTLAVARHLEQQKQPGCPSIMSHLTTDVVTAQGLLAAIQAFRAAPFLVKKWYADLVPMIFPPT